jgi:hypothetical protein
MAVKKEGRKLELEDITESTRILRNDIHISVMLVSKMVFPTNYSHIVSSIIQIWGRRWDWLGHLHLRVQQKTSCCQVRVCLDSSDIEINVFPSNWIQLTSLPCWSWSLLSLLFYLLHHRGQEQQLTCHHPTLNRWITSIAWQAEHCSSKSALPLETSPAGTVTSGSLIYFFLGGIRKYVGNNYNVWPIIQLMINAIR